MRHKAGGKAMKAAEGATTRPLRVNGGEFERAARVAERLPGATPNGVLRSAIERGLALIEREFGGGRPAAA